MSRGSGQELVSTSSQVSSAFLAAETILSARASAAFFLECFLTFFLSAVAFSLRLGFVFAEGFVVREGFVVAESFGTFLPEALAEPFSESLTVEAATFFALEVVARGTMPERTSFLLRSFSFLLRAERSLDRRVLLSRARFWRTAAFSFVASKRAL